MIPATGASKKKLGEAAACAVKRIHLDKRIVEAATSVGANLMEEFEVSTSDVTFDKATGIWTVKSITVSISFFKLQLAELAI